ncbi:Sesquiterpene synthase Agr1, partial [Desmophyllum pertusum]
MNLDPCRNITCMYHSHCEASSPWQFACVCEDSCPSYEEQVCASDGRTFNNLCFATARNLYNTWKLYKLPSRKLH